MSLHLTSRQSNILEFIRARVAQAGQAPTLEEIGQAMGLPNVSAVLKHVRSLEAKGRLAIEPNRSRGIRLVNATDALEADTLELPLVGRIAAGEPLFSEARIERTLRVSRWLFRLRITSCIMRMRISVLLNGIRMKSSAPSGCESMCC